jgi:hypothetical protein
MNEKKWSSQQKETLKSARQQAEKILKACEEADAGHISGEEFDRRVSKTGFIKGPGLS